MDDLLITPTTRTMLEAYAKNPPHALLFIGPDGIGKRALAITWAASISPIAPQLIEPDEKGSISVGAVRELYKAVRSKREHQQIIVVDHAETMSIEAENAFLKLLEEPRPGVTFILTAPHDQALLPTILSRVQKVAVQPISNKALDAFARKQQKNLSATDLTQLLFIANGRPATLRYLLDNPTVLAQEREHMRLAKDLLAATPYDRFTAINKLNDRQTCSVVLVAMLKMTSMQLAKSTQPKQIRHWLAISQATQQALEQLDRNGNVKAQLLRLFAAL